MTEKRWTLHMLFPSFLLHLLCFFPYGIPMVASVTAYMTHHIPKLICYPLSLHLLFSYRTYFPKFQTNWVPLNPNWHLLCSTVNSTFEKILTYGLNTLGFPFPISWPVSTFSLYATEGQIQHWLKSGKWLNSIRNRKTLWSFSPNGSN